MLERQDNPSPDAHLEASSSRMTRSPHRSSAVAALSSAFLACALLSWVGLESWMDERLLTLGVRLRPAPPPAQQVSVVMLRSEARDGRPISLRAALAELLDHLVTTRARPKAVVVDVLLSEPETDGNCLPGSMPLSTRIFSASERLGVVVHAASVSADRREYHEKNPPLAPLRPFLFPDQPDLPVGEVARYWHLPHPDILERLFAGAAGVGSVSLRRRASSGPTGEPGHEEHLFRLPLLTRVLLAPSASPQTSELGLEGAVTPVRNFGDTGLLPSLSLAGAIVVQCQDANRLASSTQAAAFQSCLKQPFTGRLPDGTSIPLDSEGQLRLQYRRQFQVSPEEHERSLPSRALEVLAFRDSFSGGPALLTVSGQEVSAPALDPRALVVLDARERQSFQLPLGPAFPPATVHAQALNALLSHDWMLPVSRPVQWLVWLLGVLSVLFLRSRRGAARGSVLLARWLWRLSSSLSERTWTRALSSHWQGGCERWPTLRTLDRAGRLMWGSLMVLGMVLAELLVAPELLLVAAALLVSFGLLAWSPWWWPPGLTLFGLVAAGIGWRVAGAPEVEPVFRKAQQHFEDVLGAEDSVRDEVEALTRTLAAAREHSVLSDESLRGLSEVLETARSRLHLDGPLLPSSSETAGLPERPLDPASLEKARQSLEQSLERLEQLRVQNRAATHEAWALREGQQSWQYALDALKHAFELIPATQGRAAASPVVLPGPFTGLTGRRAGGVPPRARKRLRPESPPQKPVPAPLAAPPPTRTVVPAPLAAPPLEHVSPQQDIPAELEVPPLSPADEALLERLEVVTCDPRILQNLRLMDEKLRRFPKAAVLILGETGTGKEVLARALYYSCREPGDKFIAINFGSLNTGSLQSELEGHLRGSFTGAIKDRLSPFVDAGGGVVLLDEVGEMPAEVQVALLRILQEREVRPMGANCPQPIRCRIVAATHRSLQQQVRAGRFREDLLNRLNAVVLTLPPLRERRHDIPLLVHRFLQQQSGGLDAPAPPLEDSALHRLQQYSWPGNVRELSSVVQRLIMNSTEGKPLTAEDVARAITMGTEGPLPAVKETSVTVQPPPSAPEPLPLPLLDPEPLQWLKGLREAHFTVDAYARQGELTRKRADAQLRILCVLVLPLQAWSIEETARALTGQGGGPSFERVLRRLRLLLERLEDYQAVLESEGEDALKKRLRGDYGTYRAGVLEALSALREGRLKGVKHADPLD